MPQYVDKSALVAEIKRRMDENSGKQTLPQYFGMVEEDLNILSILGTLEVKEVDLEREINDYFITVDLCEGEKITENTFRRIAKHFFELGLKTQKGEEKELL